jgi:imidazolonepropionase-like amidohydrolase
MRSLRSFATALSLIGSACLPSAFAADLLIENITLVSPQLPAPLKNRHVLVRDGRIAQVSEKAIAAKGAKRLDGRGKFLTPGLMDSHVHVTDPASLGMDPDPAMSQLREAYFRQQPRSYLYFGVTQLLDLNGYPEGIDTFNAQPRHPDLFRCIGVTALNGYPTAFMDKAVRYKLMPTYIFEPANAAQHPMPPGEDPAAHTPEAVVNLIATTDARCVKVFIEKGWANNVNWPILSAPMLKRVRDAAQQRGLLVIAHANALDMQRIALETKVDVIAHGLWSWNEYDGQPNVPSPIATHLTKIRDQRVGYQPTLRVLYSTADLFRADTLKDPMYAKVVPRAVLDWYGTDAGQWYKRAVRTDFGGAPDMKIMQGHFQVAERGMRAARYLHQLGHPLLLASDTPSSPTYGNQPGYDTYREMRAMAQAGISLAAIFQAGTVNNARQFKLDRDYGTVEPGKVANLLLLNASPLETIRAWSQIDKVILKGEVIERETLAAGK